MIFRVQMEMKGPDGNEKNEFLFFPLKEKKPRFILTQKKTGL